MKGIYIFAITLLLLSSVAMAQSAPRPIAVKLIDAQIASGVDIQITDIASGTSHSYVTNEYGELIADASDFYGARDSDNFQVKVMVCQNNPSCTQIQSLGIGVYFEFNLNGIYTPTPFCPSCPVIPSCEAQGYISPDQCPVAPACPVVNTATWSAIAVAIVAIMGALLKMFGGKKSKIETYLKKNGSVGYRIYAWLPYITSTGKASNHWVKVKDW